MRTDPDEAIAGGLRELADGMSYVRPGRRLISFFLKVNSEATVALFVIIVEIALLIHAAF
jgi:hypothetical protein